MNIVNQLMLGLVRALHRVYKSYISPLLGDNCRFHPVCSDYALEAIERHGILKGSWLALKRVVRCNPYCKGGLDPVPETVIRTEEVNGKD